MLPFSLFIDKTCKFQPYKPHYLIISHFIELKLFQCNYTDTIQRLMYVIYVLPTIPYTYTFMHKKRVEERHEIRTRTVEEKHMPHTHTYTFTDKKENS